MKQNQRDLRTPKLGEIGGESRQCSWFKHIHKLLEKLDISSTRTSKFVSLLDAFDIFLSKVYKICQK